MSIPFFIFPLIPPMNVNEFRGNNFLERLEAGQEYRANCLEAPERILCGGCRQSKSGEWATQNWNFRGIQGV
jgi:hypothetical protein